MEESILEKIGLTKSEIKVYTALLELGSSSTGKIVDKSQASSSKIYEILDKLIQKGLVSFIIKSGVKYFEAAPPERIMEYVKEKEQEFTKQKDELKKLLPELELKQKLAKYKSEATIFKGMKGGETAFRYALEKMRKGDEWLAFVVKFEDETYYNLLTKLHKLRSQKGFKARLILDESEREAGKEREKIPLTDIKYVSDSSKSPSIVNVIGDITLINIMAEDVTVFMIESKDVSDSFRNQFEKLWNEEIIVYKGTENVTSFLDGMMNTLKKGDEYYVLNGNVGLTTLPTVKDFFTNYHKKRIDRGVNVKMLYNYNVHKKINEIVAQPAELKMLPPEFKSPLQVFFYKDKTYMTLWEKDPLGILINNKHVTDGFRVYFESLWNQKVQTYQGQEGAEAAYNFLLDNCKPSDEIIVFAAKPSTERGAKFNLQWNMEIRKKVRRSRLLYYGDTEINRKRAEEIASIGAETKIMHTSEALPISTIVVGDHIVDVVWGDDPVAFRFENKKLAEAYRTNFEIMWNQDTRIVKGINAVKDIWEDMLNYKECDFIAARGYFVDREPEYANKWEKRAAASGFKMRNIVDPEVKGHRITKFPFVETKYTLPKEFANLSVIWLYGNKVIIANWAEEEPIITIIENKRLHEMYKQQFEMLWNQDVTTQKGLQGVYNAWNMMLDYMEQGEEYYVMGAADRTQKGIYDFLVDFHKRRRKKGVKAKFLFVSKAKDFVERFKDNYKILGEVKYLPEGIYEGLQFNFFKDRILIIVWRESEPIVFTIEDPKVYQTFKTYFDVMWEGAKK